MTSCTSVINLETASDEDFSWAFQMQFTDTLLNFDFTNYNLEMMVRKDPADPEVYIAVDSYPTGYGGIIFSNVTPTGTIETFTVYITRAQMVNLPAGTYAQSMVMIGPDGLRQEIWNGTLIHNIGPTR
jgi:hypothetical protein